MCKLTTLNEESALICTQYIYIIRYTFYFFQLGPDEVPILAEVQPQRGLPRDEDDRQHQLPPIQDRRSSG